jgi:hypothetical protein
LPDGGIHISDAGHLFCPISCSTRKGYHLYCPTNGNYIFSWCPESPSCSTMDSCQASQVAACNASCPGGCALIPDGPFSCCDCAPDDLRGRPVEVQP